MKFRAKIVGIGEMVKELLDEDMLIIFNENAPEDLAEISVIHNKIILKEDVAVGDLFKIGKFEYKVTYVGSSANSTLRELGHCTFKFDGSTIPSLPGIINLEGNRPDISNIQLGSFISIS